MDSIDKDFFLKNYSEPIFELGIQHKDMLRLAMLLNNTNSLDNNPLGN